MQDACEAVDQTDVEMILNRHRTRWNGELRLKNWYVPVTENPFLTDAELLLLEIGSQRIKFT